MAQRLSVDTAYHLAAFGVMAVSGVLLNLVILGSAGEAALGVFNQVYAVYVITSQLAVFGVHDAVHVAVAARQREAARAILDGGLRAVLVVGTPLAVLLWLAAPAVGHVADSPEVGAAVRFIAPGLLLFALNKVLMGALAGQQRLRIYAVVQIVRILTLFFTTAGIALAERPAPELALGFVAAEVMILPGLLLLLRPVGGQAWVRDHLRFGSRALPHGLIAESFLRVDILMLAPFVDDAEIGIYSLAAMFAAGLHQIGATLRTVTAPRMVPLLLPGGDRSARSQLLRRVMLLGLLATTLLAAGLALGFPVLGVWLDPSVVRPAHELLLVLMVGLVVYGPFLPLDGVLLWGQRPGLQSAMMATNIAVNAALNLALVPTWGLQGAAVATALAWGFSALSLQVASARWLGMRGGLAGEALRDGSK